MSAEQPGPVAPQAPVSASKAGSGPKRPPRPVPATKSTKTKTTPRPKAGGSSNGASRDDATIETESATAPAVVEPKSDAPLGFAGPLPVTPLAAQAEPISPPARDKRRGRVRQARRVQRVVRRIDLWSVLKLSLVVYTCIYLATLGTLAVVWGVLYSSGSVDKLQSFLEDVGLENFTFYGNQMFRACAAIGAVGVMAGTVVTVLATALVNIISEMTGGIRLVVIEEDVEV